MGDVTIIRTLFRGVFRALAPGHAAKRAADERLEQAIEQARRASDAGRKHVEETSSVYEMCPSCELETVPPDADKE